MYWTCPHCDSQVDDEYDLCWSCGTGRDGALPPQDWTPVIHAYESIERPDHSRKIDCLRCGRNMTFSGIRQFREDLTARSLFALRRDQGQEELEVYACGSCGKIELFLPAKP